MVFTFSWTFCGFLFGEFQRKNNFYRLSEIVDSLGTASCTALAAIQLAVKGLRTDRDFCHRGKGSVKKLPQKCKIVKTY
jgi:hypothetical protein